jgi:hypothetical protein
MAIFLLLLRVNAATVRHRQTNAKVDNLLFGWELVRDLCTPIIMERMANEK